MYVLVFASENSPISMRISFRAVVLFTEKRDFVRSCHHFGLIEGYMCVCVSVYV